MQADKTQPDKPRTLDYVLAFTPIPVIGENRARRVAKHLADQDERFGTPFPDYNREENVHTRFMAARKIAYLIPFSAIAGAYVLSQTL